MFDTFKLFKIIPQQTIGVLERFGRYKRLMQPGLNFKIPFVDNISYIHSLKEESIHVERQMAITKDNVSLEIDGILFIKIDDAYKASYSIEDPHEAVKLLTLTLMRSEIGKIDLDNLFQERQRLNEAILRDLKQCSDIWGISCLRYEILNIDPPEEIKKSMQQEAEAERNKRRQILISEGKRQSEINIAEGQKSSTIQRAEGQAESIVIKTDKEAQAIDIISKSLEENNLAANYILSQSYLQRYKQNLKSSNVVVYPESSTNGQQDLMGLASVLWMQNQKLQPSTPAVEQKPEQVQVQSEKLLKREKPMDQKSKYDDPILESTDEDRR